MTIRIMSPAAVYRKWAMLSFGMRGGCSADLWMCFAAMPAFFRMIKKIKPYHCRYIGDNKVITGCISDKILFISVRKQAVICL